MRCSPIDSEQLPSKARIFDSLGGSEMWDWDLACPTAFSSWRDGSQLRHG